MSPKHPVPPGFQLVAAALLLCAVNVAAAPPEDDRIDLNKTTIKGNAELPKYLYVVPWRDKANASLPEKKLRLHNLYGDLFDPVKPDYTSSLKLAVEPNAEPESKAKPEPVAAGVK